MPSKLSTKSISFTAIIGLIVGFFMGGDVAFPLDQAISGLSQAAQSQIAQAGFFFTLAAWVHSGRVKKEIKSNFEGLTLAIHGVAEAFKQDLKKHGERLDNLASRVESLETSNKE